MDDGHMLNKAKSRAGGETEINGKITKKASSFHFKLAVPLHYDWIFSEGAWPIDIWWGGGVGEEAV